MHEAVADEAPVTGALKDSVYGAEHPRIGRSHEEDERLIGAIDRALSQRPDLMQQDAEIRSANARVQEARSAYHPALSLNASPAAQSVYGLQSPSDWTHTAGLTGGLSFSLRWTIFDGSARKKRPQTLR